MIGKQSVEKDTEVFDLDFTDVFWQILSASCERPYGGKRWKFKRSAQGSRNGPLSWAGPFSLLLRCTQGLFTRMSAETARGQLYVDDPVIAMSGTRI